MESDEYTLDFQLQKTRNHPVTYDFMKIWIKHFGEPSVLTPDQASSLLCTCKQLQKIAIIYLRNTVQSSTII